MGHDPIDRNLLKTFRNVAAVEGDRPFLWAKSDGSYHPWSWERVSKEISMLANALAALGLERGDRVLLVSENRPEWLITDMAIMTAGGITVPAYTTNTVADHTYLLEHSGANVAVCSTTTLAERLVPAMHACEKKLKAVIGFDGSAIFDGAAERHVDFQEALRLGADSPDVDLTDELTKDDLACFIYTSGTGGQPKGVMLSHGNILANVRGARELLKLVNVGQQDVFLSFLPLSHSYEHTAGQFFPMVMGAQIYYADGVDSLSTNLLEAKPTVLPCVPRLYEVLRARILAGVRRQGGFRARLFDLALELGRERYEAGGRLAPHKALLDMLLEKLVREKVKARFGGRLEAMVSGGAPLNYDVGLFFVSLGLPVLQGYGQTEAAPVISANVPGRSKIDTVGPALDGVELVIAEDGEILVRGENVMKGYWRDPEATAATVVDGWLHTGDIGELDEEGRLRITDRKKDLIVNSGGDNVSPQRVEGVLNLEPEIAQVLTFGDRRPYLVALVVVEPEWVKRWAKEQGLTADVAALKNEKSFVNAVAAAVKRANDKLSQIERIRRYHIMDEPFSVENGMMTPTLKLRRPIIVERYGSLIEGLYRSGK